jgi:hypothetical protein
LGGNVTTTGSQTYNDALSLTADAVLLSADTLVFANTVTNDAAGALTLTALNGIGLGGNVSSLGNIAFNGEVTINANLIINSTSGDLLFANRILNKDSATYTSAYNLELSALVGLVTLGDSVGIATTTVDATLPSSLALNDLTVRAETIRILGDVLTRRNQLFDGAVLIGDNGTKGALYEYYLTLMDPLSEIEIDNPVLARTLISIDPSIVFTQTVDDVEENTHTLFTAAIKRPGDPGQPIVEFKNEVGSFTPLYSINVLTLQDDARGENVGTIKLFGSVNTFFNQAYRSGTLFAEPAGELNAFTFTVDAANATISFDLFKSVADNTVALINSSDRESNLVFNGPTAFKGETTMPDFPVGKWANVTTGMSLSALAASRAGGGGAIAPIQRPGSEVPPFSISIRPEFTPPSGSAPVSSSISARPVDRTGISGSELMAAIQASNNFELTNGSSGGSVSVSMGVTAKEIDCKAEELECKK